MKRASRSLRIAAWLVTISYGVAAPVTAFAEFRAATLSQRFGYPPEFIYLVCAVQLACVAGFFMASLAPWAAAGLTVITLGAVASHVVIGSPVAAIPALVYTVVQVWLGIKSRTQRLFS